MSGRRQRERRRKKRALIPAAIVLCVVLAPGRSFGWGKTWLGANLEKAIAAARWSLGPVKADAAFKLSNLGYDSDIYFGSLGGAVPDATFRTGPELNLYIPLDKGIVVGVSEAPDYVFFLRTTQERAWNNTVRGEVHFALNKLYFQAGAGSMNVKERASTELFLNVRRTENDFGGFAFWQVGEGTSIALRYRHAALTYENPDQEDIDISASLNRREDALALTVYLLQLRKARLYIDAEYGRFAPYGASSMMRESWSLAASGGIEFSPAPSTTTLRKKEERDRIMGRLNLGFKRFSIPHSPFKDFSGLVGNTALDARVLKMTSLRLVFSRDVQFSAYSTLGYYLQTNLGGGITQVLGKAAGLSYDVSVGRNAYTPLQGEPAGATRQDDFLTHSLGLAILLGKDLGLGLSAGFARRSTNLTGQVFRRTFVGLSLTYGETGGLPSIGSRASR
jgi:hypothetical protein